MIERVHDDTSTYDLTNFSCRVSLFTGARLNNIFFVSNDIKYIYMKRNGLENFFYSSSFYIIIRNTSLYNFLSELFTLSLIYPRFKRAERTDIICSLEFGFLLERILTEIVKNSKRNPCQLVGFIRVHGGEARDVREGR